jgi:hypothetical protein
MIMHTTTSKDGTTIAYEKLGSGPPLVLVDGAFCRRAFGPMPALAKLLAEHFTVLHYDRRLGRMTCGFGGAASKGDGRRRSGGLRRRRFIVGK